MTKLNNKQIERVYKVLDFDENEEITEALYLGCGRFILTLIDERDKPIVEWEYRPNELEEWKTKYILEGVLIEGGEL